MYEAIDELSSWNEIKTFFDGLNSRWIFRGQQSYKWDLRTGIDRHELRLFEVDKDTRRFVEHQMLDKLSRHLYNIPETYRSMLTSNIQKIAFMQHYGAPTRLLDFTMSPYVALFFALENAVEDCAVYAVNRFELVIRNKILLGINNSHQERFKEYFEKGNLSDPGTFDKIVLGNPQYQFADMIQPYFKFDRLINQSGCFLCQGDITVTFEENLKKSLGVGLQTPRPFYKIKIPVAIRQEILSDLKLKMNIDRSTLFPGIDGFVQSLAMNSTIDLFESLRPNN